MVLGLLTGLILISCQTLQSKEIRKTSLGKQDVTAEVSVPNSVSPGQPVEMLVKITNDGSQTVYYACVDGIRELGIRLVGYANSVPELTPSGKKVIGVPEIYFSYLVEPLKPGEHYEWRVDLATLFNFRPGTYQVSVNLEFNGAVPGVTPFNISTEPLEFTEETIQASQTNL